MELIKKMSPLIIEVIDHIRNMHYEEGIPNKTVFNDNEFIVNINFGPRVDDLVMSVHVYHVNMDDFMADYVLFHSQPMYYWPEGSTQDNMLFSITGAPKGGVFNCSTTIESSSLHSAIDDAFSYVVNNIEDILTSYYYPKSHRI